MCEIRQLEGNPGPKASIGALCRRLLWGFPTALGVSSFLHVGKLCNPCSQTLRDPIFPVVLLREVN